MPSVAKATHAVRRPGNDMGYAGRHLLLAARTPIGLGRVDASDPADEPLAVAVRLAPFDPADGSVQVELGPLVTSAMGSGHAPIIAGRAVGEHHARLCRELCHRGYRGGDTRSANATMLSS
jgi:hypothetical protein